MIASAPERSRDNRRRLGQFFTPPSVAVFMAALFSQKIRGQKSVRILDAGAGSGRLTEALVERLVAGKKHPEEITATVWEMDEAVLPLLRETLDRCRARCEAAGIRFTATVRTGNFILEGAERVRPGLFGAEEALFDLAIVNPPYRKLNSNSAERAALSEFGLETSNLYTAFLGLISRLLRPGGELVAITPRSFCNGAYFRPFRRDFLSRMAVRRLHLIESRTKTFSTDAVLQETLIFHAVRDAAAPATVGLSESPGAPDGNEPVRVMPWTDIVRPDDAECFIHLPAEGAEEADAMAAQPYALKDLRLEVSTGRVVAFRSKPWLHESPAADDAPLLWATHLDGQGGIRWPLGLAKRPEALARCAGTESMILPPGCYVVVKRLTAKEERRRVVASVVESAKFGSGGVAFENHLNFFHSRGRGLDPKLAYQLCEYLNSEFVDRWFRLFNGHTQVNATDLRALRFPDFGVIAGAPPVSDETDFMLNETPDSHA